MTNEICENLDDTFSNKVQEQLSQFATLSELINSKFFDIKATLEQMNDKLTNIDNAMNLANKI